MLFDVERRTVAGHPALIVRGELDLSTAPRLGAAADELLAGPVSDLVVDLTPTTFLDSSGARALLALARRAEAAGVRLHVLAPQSNRPVRIIVDLLGLGAYVPLVDSADELPTSSVGRTPGT